MLAASYRLAALRWVVFHAQVDNDCHVVDIPRASEHPSPDDGYKMPKPPGLNLPGSKLSEERESPRTGRDPLPETPKRATAKLTDGGPEPSRPRLEQETGAAAAGKPATSSRNLARSEMSATVNETFGAIIKQGLELAADAHGLGALVRGAEGALAAVKWVQVAGGDRGVDVEFPIPLGSGFELDLSMHAGRSPSAADPPVTFCFAPVSGPDPGVLVADGCQISPGDKVGEETPTGEGKNSVLLVPVDLSPMMSRDRDPQTRTAALMLLGRDRLVPALMQQRLWNHLEEAGVERVVCYDQHTKNSVWLFLGTAEGQAVRTRISFDAAGRLEPADKRIPTREEFIKEYERYPRFTGMPAYGEGLPGVQLEIEPEESWPQPDRRPRGPDVLGGPFGR